MTLDREVLQMAIRVRRRLNDSLGDAERAANYSMLIALAEYADQYARRDAKFVRAMLGTYRDARDMHTQQMRLVDVPQYGAKYLNTEPSKRDAL